MLQAAGGAGQAGNALQRDELDDSPAELLEAEQYWMTARFYY
jgi:hypothetical protein